MQEHVLAQAAELTKRGHDVRIITPKPRNHHQNPPKNMLFVGDSTNVKTPISTNAEVAANFTRNAIEELLETEQFDLIHVHEPEVPMLGSQIISKATCPVIATFHAMMPPTTVARTIGAIRSPLARPIYNRLSAITAVSNVAAEFVSEHTDHHISIIPNGIDLSKYKFQNSVEVSKVPQILYVGRLEKRKGVRYLLQAYKKLCEVQPKLKCKLVIVGDGPQRRTLETYVQEHDLPRVSFLGYVSEARKLKLLGEADLFCSPAIYGESFGIVLLEAMARGTVAVAGNNPGYEAVMEGTGRLSIVNPKDTDEFARRLELFLTNESLRKMWLQWAKEYVKQYDYNNVIDQYEALYKNVLKKAKS